MRHQIGLRVAKGRSCDLDESEFFSGETPHELWCWEEAGSQKFAVRPGIFCDPASSQHHNSGGVHREKIPTRPNHSYVL